MKSKYKVLGFVGVSLLLVALLLVAVIPVVGQGFPSEEIALNLRHSQGEIIELAGPSSLEDCERFQEYVQKHKDAFWFVDDPQVLVGLFVQEFVYARDLIDDVLYRDIHQNGTARIGVTSRDVIDELKELGIPITFEIIDLDEVRHLEEAAREIAGKHYVMGAFYSHSEGRIIVELDKPNWGLYDAIYRGYLDYPLLFSFADPQPELDHGGGERIRVGALGGTSGFLADWYGQDVMVTAGHMGLEDMPVKNIDYELIGMTEVMVDEGIGDDAGFYTAEEGVDFNNVIDGTIGIDGWAEYNLNVDDLVYYTSSYRGTIWGQVTAVYSDYIKYWRSDGGPGDSGSPVYTVSGEVIIQGVHTHGNGEGYGSYGYATTIDQVQDLLDVGEPRVATTLELSPAADSNPVGTTHNLKATVYDQFNYTMEGVDVTWNISGPGSFVSQDTTTDAAGQANAVITSSLPGTTSTVRCEVTGNPSVYATATKYWTYFLDVEKYVKDNSGEWKDADRAPGPYILQTQDPVIFKFTIQNTGSSTLTNVNLTDADISTFYNDEGCTIVASFPTILAVDETKTYYGKLDWEKGQQYDEATVVGTPVHVTDWKLAGTGENIDRGYWAWFDPSRVIAKDDYYTYCELPYWEYSDWLSATNFGFTTSDIPSGAIIDGIEVRFRRYGTGSIWDTEVILRDSGGQTGDAKSDWPPTIWPYSAGEQTLGGSSDMWGTSLEDSDIRDYSFGVDMYCRNWDMGAGTAYVDSIEISVYFTEAGSDVGDNDPAYYYGSDPSIDVEKYVKDSTGTWQDADNVTGPYIPNTQNPLIFKFMIHNTGNVDLTSVNLTDADISTFYTDEGCTTEANFPTILAVDETKTYYGKLDWVAGQQYDEATVVGTPVGEHVTDWKLAGTGDNIPRVEGWDWEYPTKVTAKDDYYTYCELPYWEYSDWLSATNFGFTTSDIPSGATIDGIEVRFRRYGTGSIWDSIWDTEVILRDSGGQTGDAKSGWPPTIWPYSVGEQTLGGSSDMWGTSLEDSDIRDYSFGVDMYCRNWDMGAGTAYVDSIEISVYYTMTVGSDVSDSDSAYYFGSQPSIDVEKYVKDSTGTWQDADNVTGPYISKKQNPVIFKFTIHNTGNVDLTSVNLTDTDMATLYTDEGCTTPASFPTTLVVDETRTFYGKLAWAKGQQDDTATAVGQPPVGSDVSDSDPAYYYGRG